MRIAIQRTDVKVYPDSKRVLSRFFFNGEERSKGVIERVLSIPEDQVLGMISPILQEFSKRHRNITKVFLRNADKISYIFKELNLDYEALDLYRKLLLGSYFTHEYSIESAAFFNPSIVEDPDQTELEQGEKRLIMSFRAVGEGHISSIIFRRATIGKEHQIVVLPAGNYVDEADIIKNATYKKELFFEKAALTNVDSRVLNDVGSKLNENFDYSSLRRIVQESQNLQEDDMHKLEYEKVLWLSDSYHEIAFSLDTDISDRVIFPISEFERKGIEDARFVKFTEDDGRVIYYATYTAYDGSLIMPKLLQTHEFYNFQVRPLFGKGAQNKNLALFPRRINGQYVMMSRIDGWNNYIMYSKNLNVWDNPIMLSGPKYPWEFVQVGNCGSPIETEAGWLVITHGVGAMRRYCLGDSLLKLDDPSIEIGRLEEPLLVPNDNEREGYVPNVVYSCGSIIHNGKLVLPYGLSDYCSSFALVDMKELLDKLLSGNR